MAREVEHNYPKQVHLLNQGYLSSLLTQLSQPSCTQPQFNQVLKKLFRALFTEVLNKEWPQILSSVATRMTEQHPDQKLHSSIFKRDQKAVIVDIARAGMVPSQILFDELCTLADPNGLRLDHIFASRVTNKNQQVTHTALNTSKIGGDIDDAIVILPDPMGATGYSLCEVIDAYKSHVQGTPKKWVAVHLIVTPEYIKKVTTTHPEVTIFAARLDRGLSSKDALETQPGTLWDKEKGLNDIQYIVPGAGGVGEIINNSYV